MLTSAEALYLDSSALVKLIVAERESLALERFLAGRPRQVSSALVRVEVIRAVTRYGPAAVDRAREIVGDLDLVPIDNEVLDRAATVGPPTLRSLDAIHLATASLAAEQLSSLVTYDVRMRAAAQELGFRVESPGRSNEASD